MSDTTFYNRIQETMSGKYYTPDDFNDVIDHLKTCKTTKKKKGKVYINIPCAFDTETTNFSFETGEEIQDVATMYIWQLGIDGFAIIGRTWKEWIKVLSVLKQTVNISNEKRIIIYVHNNAFDFQFYHKYLNFQEVFARTARQPMYAIADGVEFRDSYLLTNSSLSSVGDNLIRYPVKKLVGDLDYKLLRHSETPLTKKEIGYCLNDILVIMCLIKTKIEDDGGVDRIPYTSTSYARRMVRSKCLPMNFKSKEERKQHFNYRSLMRTLTLEPYEYRLAKKAFCGGFTHANAMYTDCILSNVDSDDFTSSYPATMIAEKYPMSKGEEIDLSKIHSLQDIKDLCYNGGAIFTIELFNVSPRIQQDYYISYSHCTEIDNPTLDNGRVVYADRLVTTITSVDFDIITAVYGWKAIRVLDGYTYKMAHLPKAYIEAILTLYEAKTKLKGIKGKEEEYQRAKELLNALYGMMVTDISSDEYCYDSGLWYTNPSDLTEVIEVYNNDKRRFLSYLWGVFVTAYARRNVWSGIMELGDDYVYSDTDSVKYLNRENHIDYFATYNEKVVKKIDKALIALGIDPERARPENIKGKKKQIAVWDYEGRYDNFKTLGAKRYMVKKKDILSDNGTLYDYSLTVSGLNKNKAIPYMVNKFKSTEGVFGAFTDGLIVPPENSGRLIHKYIDNPFTHNLTDYLGNTMEVHEESCVNLSESAYTLGISGEYKSFIKYINSGELVLTK